MSTALHFDADPPPTNWGGRPTARVVDVGPQLAREWLARNHPRNRVISAARVADYARHMREGTWPLTHQGIAFNTSDQLIDGQHRLHAVIGAGVVVPMLVTWGLDVDRLVYTNIDTGATKRPAHMIGGKNAAVKAAAARLLTAPPRLFFARGQSFNNMQAVEIADRHPALDDAAYMANRVNKPTHINMGIMAALLTLAMESPRVEPLVEAWVDGLTSGAGLGSKDPRLALRNRWGPRAKHGAGDRNAGIYMVVRAWNAYVHGEPLQNFKLPRGTSHGGNLARDQLPEVVL